MNTGDVFNFSLIDNLQYGSNMPSCSNINLDLSKLNDTISEALKVYNNAVLKISEINTDVDKLRQKQEKMTEFTARFKESIREFKEYISTHFDEEEDDVLRGVLDSVSTIDKTVEDCKTNVISFIDKKCDKNKEAYLNSQANLNALHNVFSLVKFNKHACPICMQNEASHFTLPCGHVYCEQCVHKIKVACFVCRQNIFKISPLYFS